MLCLLLLSSDGGKGTTDGGVGVCDGTMDETIGKGEAGAGHGEGRSESWRCVCQRWLRLLKEFLEVLAWDEHLFDVLGGRCHVVGVIDSGRVNP